MAQWSNFDKEEFGCAAFEKEKTYVCKTSEHY